MAISITSLSIILAITVRYVLAADPGLAWIWPPPVGFDITSANVAPCGGFNTSHDGDITYFINQLRWNQTASEITYMTRLSENLNASDPSTQWSQLYPTIEAALEADNDAKESAQFCVPIPERPEADNQTSVFQLIANTPDGIIFACSKVRFGRDAEKSYTQTCNPSIRGNSTVTNTTDSALLSAAMLPPGASATVTTTTTVYPSGSAGSSQSTLTSHQGKHLSGGAIAGIVIGSVVGAIALIGALLFLLCQRRRKAARDARVRKSSAATSTAFSGSSSNSQAEVSQAGHNKETGVSELPAVVPSELDSTQRMELAATDSEKMYRPELAGDSAPPRFDEKDPALFRDEEAPQTPTLAAPNPSPATTNVSPNRRSYETATMSPVSGGSETMSPVSPISPRSPVFHRNSLSR